MGFLFLISGILWCVEGPLNWDAPLAWMCIWEKGLSKKFAVRNIEVDEIHRWTKIKSVE